MSRVSGVFMALLLSVFSYALGQGSVDSTKPRIEAKESLKAEEQEEASNNNHIDNRESNKGVKSPPGEAVGERAFPWFTSNQWTAIGTIAIALFTIALSIVSFCQWRAIKKANSVAKEAADATKRSVDAYIGRERGRLVIGECYRPDRLSNQIKFHYVNVGPTELTVLSFGAIPVPHVIGKDFSIPVIPTAVATEVVKPGEEFGGGTRKGLFFQGLPGSITIPHEIFMRLSSETNVRVLAAFRMTYTTAFGHYVKQQVFVLENHGPIDIMHRDLCYDLPHAEWVEKYGKKEEKK